MNIVFSWIRNKYACFIICKNGYLCQIKGPFAMWPCQTTLCECQFYALLCLTTTYLIAMTVRCFTNKSSSLDSLNMKSVAYSLPPPYAQNQTSVIKYHKL